MIAIECKMNENEDKEPHKFNDSVTKFESCDLDLIYDDETPNEIEMVPVPHKMYHEKRKSEGSPIVKVAMEHLDLEERSYVDSEILYGDVPGPNPIMHGTTSSVTTPTPYFG